MTIIKLPIHWKISTNKIYAGVHWTTRSEHKENYRNAYTSFFKQMQPFTDQVTIEYNFIFKSRPLDSSNCSYMGKLLEDCMVKAGLIKDDSTKYVAKTIYSSEKGLEDSVSIQIKSVDK